MPIIAERASLDEVLVDDILVVGVRDAKFVSKRTQKEIIIDDETAIRRMGLLKDADLSLTLLHSPGDPGQQAILASDRNNTQCEYVVVKGSVIFVAIAGVGQLGFPNSVSDENIIEVVLSTSNDILIMFEGMN